MIYSSFISILIIFLVFFGAYFIGKYITQTQEIFTNNVFASWTLGFIVYVFINFVIFLPFLWITPSIAYFDIVFLIKEFILYVLIFMNWDKIKPGLEFKSIGWIIGAGTILAIGYHYLTLRYMNIPFKHTATQFESWYKFIDSVQNWSKIDSSFITDWTFTIISTMVAYTAVTAFLIEIIKRHNYPEYIYSFVITMFLITFVNMNSNIVESLGIYLVLFMMTLSMHIIIFSRRRYAFLFGLSAIAVDSVDSKMIIVMPALALITMIIYAYHEKPKISLFWVQVIMPMFIITSLRVYKFSTTLALVLFLASLFLYAFMLSVGRLKFLDKFNEKLIEYKILLPSIITTMLFITGAIFAIIGRDTIAWNELSSFREIFITNTKDYLWVTWTQVSLFVILLSFIIWKVLLNKQNGQILLSRNVVLIFFLIICLMIFNPIVEILFDKVGMNSEFARLPSIATIPIFITGIAMIRKKYRA